MQPNQADSELKEGHLLNFVVNGLDEELTLDLGEEVELTPDELIERSLERYGVERRSDEEIKR